MIKVKAFSELSTKEISDIHQLITSCIEYEQLEITLPDLSEEEGTAYLYYASKKDQTPVSVLFCYDLEDYLEVSGFTNPSKRCQGLFTSLFQKLLDDCGEVPVCFYLDGNSYDALMTMQVLDCEYAGTEHMMVLKNRPVRPDSDLPVIVKKASHDDLDTFSQIHSLAFEMEIGDSGDFLEQAFNTGETLWCISKADSPNEICGMVITSIQDDQTSLYALAVSPQYQGQKIGHFAIESLLQMPDINFPVTLHVTEENTAAYLIYKNLGFLTTQELMEYWY